MSPPAERLKKAYRDPHFALVVLASSIYRLVSSPWHRLTFAHFGSGSFVHPRSSVRPRRKVHMGANVVINRCVTIWCVSLTIGSRVQINPGTAIYGEVMIGDDVMIAPNCMLAGGNHGIDRTDIPMNQQQSTCRGPIVIEDDCWIGANTVITDGVLIARGSVIGAGSVVRKNTLPNSINAGNPCRFIRWRNQEFIIDSLAPPKTQP